MSIIQNPGVMTFSIEERTTTKLPTSPGKKHERLHLFGANQTTFEIAVKCLRKKKETHKLGPLEKRH
jgi:hypothetical protein